MRTIVDEMPKNRKACDYHGYNYFIEEDICNKDYIICDLDLIDKKCRFYKELQQPVKDDCK